VLSYSVTARAVVVRQGLGLSALGLAIGLLGAHCGSALFQQLLFRVPAHDLRTFAVQAAVLAAVCVLAAYLPARRASRVDPITALRAD
jgi:ABC-type antimicrobial peptide transport system permease subunit